MELPCLSLYHGDRSTELFSASKEKLIVDGDADELLRNKTICPTARGLLLVRDPDTMATFLWKPSNGDQVHLPPLRGLHDATLMHSHCLLSDDPAAAAGGCVVLVVEGGDDTFLWYCRPGDDAWVRYDYDIGTQILPAALEEEEDQYEKSTICPIAACRGKFFFNGSPTELGVLEFSPDPVTSFIAIDDELSQGSNDVLDEAGDKQQDCEDYEPEPAEAVLLVESDDELYKVRLLYATTSGNEIDGAYVDRWDFSEQRWRGVDDLGGRTFLLSLFYFSASCSGGGQHGLQQDCVYIAYPRRKEMQVFDVKGGTNCLRKLDEAPAADKAFWLLPASASSTS